MPSTPSNKPHPSNKPSLENIDVLFTYKRPSPTTVPKYEAINAAARDLVKVIIENAPDCADRSAAIRNVRTARMEANAAIACDPEE